MTQLLTRAEIEQRLEMGLVGKMVKFETIQSTQVVGKLQRLAVNLFNGEMMVVFMLLISSKLQKYECDIRYFNENLEILYGNTCTGERRNIRRILEGNR